MAGEIKNIHQLPNQPPPGGGVGSFQAAQSTPLFDGTEWVHTGAGGEVGTQIDYDQLVDVVARPGNRWRTADREYVHPEVFQVTLRELAAHPSTLQAAQAFQAEQARNAMLRPAQEAARKRTEQMRSAVGEQLDVLRTPEGEARAKVARQQWMRQQAQGASTKERLDQLLADQAIDQETYRARLVELIPTAQQPVPVQVGDRQAGADTAEADARRFFGLDRSVPLQGRSIKDRLAELRGLYSECLIDKETYQRRQAEILAEV